MLVSIGMLVAVLAFLSLTYKRLSQLRDEVRGAWKHWTEATRHRNMCLEDFADVYARLRPKGDMVSRQLRRLADDSNRTLLTLKEPCSGDAELSFLPGAEWLVLRAVQSSVGEVEREGVLRDNEQMQQLCGLMSMAIYQQENRTRTFNHAVTAYNATLRSPLNRLMAPLLGFHPAVPLELKQVGAP